MLNERTDLKSFPVVQSNTDDELDLDLIRSCKSPALAAIVEEAAEVKADELKRAKDNILKGGAFDFDSTVKIVERLMTYEYFGYPKDFIFQYLVELVQIVFILL